MTTALKTPEDIRGMRTLRWMLGAAGLGFVLAFTAGLILQTGEIEAGSTTEAVLGIGAAVSGLSVAAFLIGAAIYAQVKNLWRFAPAVVRTVFLAVLTISVLISIANQILNLF